MLKIQQNMVSISVPLNYKPGTLLMLVQRVSRHQIHRLPAEQWRSTSVVHVDIVKDPVNPTDYQPDEDPSKVTSHKTGRGPFQGTRWWEKVSQAAAAVVRVKIKFK
uniref:Phosphatidylinositol transfer protein N-terminal domain-containing protein n=1 Tax=Scylla olivacea TaxID=85551 RepID=A0A0P4WS10_SCYOL